jgi:Uncharacterized protein, similar to the N-terminal domain of Lon protease
MKIPDELCTKPGFSVLGPIFDRIGEPNERGCREWNGSRIGGKWPYGQVRFHGRLWLVHRLVYTLLNGSLEDSINVCHTCDNPPCAEPSHLFEGTQTDNMKDCLAKGRYVQPKRAVGEAHHWTKLTAAQVAEIRSTNESARSIAARFGVGASGIYRIRKFKTWNRDERLVKA